VSRKRNWRAKADGILRKRIRAKKEDMLEGIILAMACLNPNVPRLRLEFFQDLEVSPTARACGELARFHHTERKRSNWVEPFVEPPAEDLHSWPTSFFTDSGDPAFQMPMRTTSTWDPVRRGHNSWQA
jgi:hypothetical protein